MVDGIDSLYIRETKINLFYFSASFRPLLVVISSKVGFVTTFFYKKKNPGISCEFFKTIYASREQNLSRFFSW